MHHVPWSVVLMMLNDLTKEKKKKGETSDPGTQDESYELIASEEEAYKYFNL